MTISLFTQRVIYSNDGTLSDWSTQLNDYTAGSVTVAGFVAAEDYIYIGAALPFNQKYFDVGATPNAESSDVSVALWDGGSWVSAVDVVDRTAASGASLAQDGYIQFRPDIDNSLWARESRSEDVTGLTGTEIYHMYWARFAWSGDLTASVVLKHVGHKFSTDSELYGQYANLDNSDLRAAYNSGTDPNNWDLQTFAAAEMIIADLTERSVITSADQIIDVTRLKQASIHKTAAICFGPTMGPAYEESRKIADARYKAAMNMKNFYIDVNRSADLEPSERVSSTVVMHR
jgi:hypothetical protein